MSFLNCFVLFLILLSCAAQDCSAMKRGPMTGYGTRGASTAGEECCDQTRKLSVQGYGEVSMKPDICYISFRIESKDQSAAVAYRKHQVQMRKVLSALKQKSVGMADRDLQTRGLSLQPQYRYNSGDGKQIFTHYLVQQELHVSVRVVDSVSTVLDAGVEAGADVNSINFTLEKQHEHESAASQEAYADVKRKADAIAAATGMTLGKPLSIQDEASTGFVPVRHEMMMAKSAMSFDSAAGGGSSSTVESGEVKVGHRVDIVYEIF
jgi:uncharacterized protein YggE